jgi:hypothetical protein
MRRIAKTDANQQRIVNALRDMGCTVQILATVGSGCPDLVVGFRGRNLMLECKEEKANLTEDQEKWHKSWNGQVAIVRGVKEAADAVLSDQSKYRHQKCQMMLRDKKLAILGDPLPDGSYCVTVADGSCTREVLLPANPDIFEILDEILKLATRMQEQESGKTRNT